MSALPKNLIGHDMLPHLTSKDKKRAAAINILKRFIVAILITAVFAIVSHMANAGINKRTLIAKSSNLEYAADCYGYTSYLDNSSRPEYLVSPEMSVFITLHGKGGELTECDMQ